MKLSKIALLAAVLVAPALLTGCSKSYLGSAALNETMNAVSDVSMPVKINSTFTVKKLNKTSSGITLDLDIAKSATGSIDKYISSDLQGAMGNTAICYLPELKAGSTPVTLKVYQGGVLKKTINKSAKYLCQ